MATGKSGAIAEAEAGVWELPRRLGLDEELERVQRSLSEWAVTADEEVRPMLSYQLAGRAKYFRPVTVFACHKAVNGNATASKQLVRSAAAIELFHNYTLVVDDIVDRSRYRRGRLALHCRFDSLRALMAGAYLAWGGTNLVSDDPLVTGLISELGKRLVAIECYQWRTRGERLGLSEWRRIAGEDTGVMFETCARLGTGDARLAEFGYLLGTLYHGCDDIADIRGTEALGGSSEKDVTDRILTLPAALAIRTGEVAALFQRTDREADDELADRLRATLPEAEGVLDEIAEEARTAAMRGAEEPESLLALIEHTRALSSA